MASSSGNATVAPRPRRIVRREIAFLIAEVCQGFLQMKRYRVIDLATDVLGAQVAHQSIALVPFDANDVLVKNVPLLRANHRAG